MRAAWIMLLALAGGLPPPRSWLISVGNATPGQWIANRVLGFGQPNSGPLHRCCRRFVADGAFDRAFGNLFCPQ
jgi:hypothetical protein